MVAQSCLVRYVPKRANLPSSPRTLPLLLPPNSARLKTLGEGNCSLHFRQERRGLSSVFAVRAVAVDSDEAGLSDPVREEKPRKYYFVVANAKFMLDEEEHFKEFLFEKG